jgi:hypothetical protein
MAVGRCAARLRAPRLAGALRAPARLAHADGRPRVQLLKLRQRARTHAKRPNMMHGVSMVLLQFKRMELLQQVARASTLHGALLEVAMDEQHGAPLLRRRDASSCSRASPPNMTFFTSICSSFLKSTLLTESFDFDVLCGLVEAVSIHTTMADAIVVTADAIAAAAAVVPSPADPVPRARTARRRMQRRGRQLAHMARPGLVHAHHADGRRGRPTPGPDTTRP